MYSGIFCDLCPEEAPRIPRFFVEADLHIDRFGRSGGRKPVVVRVELDICDVCFKKRDPRVVRVQRMVRYRNPLKVDERST